MRKILVLLLIMAVAAGIVGMSVNRPYSFVSMPGLDSVRILIYTDTVSAATDSVVGINSFPASGNLTLNNINWHRIEYHAYWYGSDTAHVTDEIVNFNAPTRTPVPEVDSNGVTAYLYVGTGFYDEATGQLVARDKVLLTLIPLNVRSQTDGSFTFLPKPESKQPNDTGYVSWNIPPNTKLLPVNSKYQLTWRALDNSTLRGGLIKRFRIDSLPNPVNIMTEATEVR